METIIVICLLILIVLLVHDKIAVRKDQTTEDQIIKRINPDLPSIMGQSKSFRSFSVPNTAIVSQSDELEIIPDNLDIEYDKNETLSIQIPQEELDEVFSILPDFEEEEEEWNRYGTSIVDEGFAQGVTFEELGTVGALLQAENLQAPQKETAAAIVQKLQGTDLFSLLENSIEGASQKIAQLLDGTLTAETETSSSILRKKKINDFNIGDFI